MQSGNSSVPAPRLTDKIIEYGAWVVVPIVKIGLEVYEKIKQQGLPALIQVTASDVRSLKFPPRAPRIRHGLHRSPGC
jgi:hypothetical protein